MGLRYREHARKVMHVRFTWFQFAFPVIVAILIVSAILYRGFEKISLNMLEKTAFEVTNQSDFIINYLNDTILTGGIQTFYDEKITVLRTSEALTNTDIVLAIRTLDDFGGYSPAIYSTYVYNSHTDSFYTTSNVLSAQAKNFFDQEAVSLMKKQKDVPRMQPIYRYIPDPYSRNTIHMCTYILYEETKGEGIANAMIVNIRANWLDTVLSSFLGDMDVVLLNDQSRIIGKTYPVSPQQVRTIEKNIQQRKNEKGRFVVSTAHDKDIYLYDTFGNTQWCFVRHLSGKELFAELDIMKTTTYSVSFLMLLIVAISGLITSLRFFRPLKQVETTLQESGLIHESLSVVDTIGELVRNSSGAENIKATYMKQLRNEYLCQLLNQAPQDKEILFAEFKAYDVPFEEKKPMTILVFSFYQQELIEELENHSSVFVPLDVQGLLVVLTQEEIADETLEAICYKMGIHCGISSSFLLPGDIRERFERTKEAMAYHIFNENGTYVLYPENILDNKLTQVPYPQELEIQIVAALDQARLESAYSLYLQFRGLMTKCRFTVLLFSLKRLYLATIRNSQSVKEDLDCLEKALKEEPDCQVLDSLFRKSFEEKTAYILHMKDSRVGDIIERVCGIIEEKYTDFNLCAQSIADEINLSSIYLGKLFREHRGVSIAEKINTIRLSHACRLLETSDFPINQIARLTGFPNNKYFYTLFRKATNETPNSWRKRNGMIS